MDPKLAYAIRNVRVSLGGEGKEMMDRTIINVTQNGETIKMHRCENCWQIYRFPLENGHLIAHDNGFTLAHREYVHAGWCRSKGKF